MKINCIRLYRTKSGAWRWRITDGTNNRVIAASSEAYGRRQDAHTNLERVTGETLEIPGSGRGPSYSWAVAARV